MFLRSKRHSNKQPSCFFPSFGLPVLTLHMQGTTSIQQANSAQAPSSGLSSSIRRLQTSVSVGRWARRADHLLGLSLLCFSMKCSTWHPGCRGMSWLFAFRRGDAPSAAPPRLVSPTAPQPVPRDGNYSSIPRASPLRLLFSPGLHLAGKPGVPRKHCTCRFSCREMQPFWKARNPPGCILQRPRTKGFEAVVGGDGLRSHRPVRIPHAPAHRGCLGKAKSSGA